MDKGIVITFLLLSGIVNVIFLVVSIYFSRLSCEAKENEKKAKKEIQFLHGELEELSQRWKDLNNPYKVVARETENIPVKTIRATKYYSKYTADHMLLEMSKDQFDRQVKEDLLWVMRGELTKAICIKETVQDPFNTIVNAEINVVGETVGKYE